MSTAPHIVCTVTTDLNYDQRMQRICSALTQAGYRVSIIGCERPYSSELTTRPYHQERIRCSFRKGPAFYAEFNFRLYHRLRSLDYDLLYCVDLDTAVGAMLAARARKKKSIFDSHEHFTELPELQGKTWKKKIWNRVAKLFIPLAHARITVGHRLAEELKELYGHPFEVVRNVPDGNNTVTCQAENPANGKVILYQGALNAGRGLETMIECMAGLPDDLYFALAGEGDLSEKLREIARQSPAAKRIRFLGYVLPDALKSITASAWMGYNMLDNMGRNYYLSLANKFFDYAHAEIPSLNPNFPEYSDHLQEFKTGITIDELSVAAMREAIIEVYLNEEFYQTMKAQCRAAQQVWNWQTEQKKLLDIIQTVSQLPVSHR